MLMDHTITIATKSAPIDTLEPPTMGTLYRWECSCGLKGMAWRAMKAATEHGAEAHRAAVAKRVTDAASELLVAAKDAAGYLEACYLSDEDRAMYERLCAAIAKAEGR
jgi:hypothetical protein